ncbi:Adhesion G-protein coupled receptor G4 [Holothuria leucospilota]|uniref:Adhesion G-protein coupled receptor G4 n=1 Tax=Holothuria leucospilota TaxID=206669 RepID=A0A9Q1HKG4_HOLLE|nr:Adhesion G-protein coupled receptor G4 [Holothuria leucospilota]
MAAKIIENVTKNVEFVEGDPLRLHLILTSLLSVVAKEDSSVEVTGLVVEAINNVMNFDDKILRSNLSETARFVRALEQQITAFQKKVGNFSNILSNLGILAVKTHLTTVDHNLTFGYIGQADKGFVEGAFIRKNNIAIFGEYKLDDDEKRILASVSVSADVFGLPTEAYKNSTTVPVSFIIYRNAKLFVPYKPAQHVEKELDKTDSVIETELIASHVVSLQIEEKYHSYTLSRKPSVFATFFTNLHPKTANPDDKVESQHCVAWDYVDETGNGFWSKDGCDTLLDDRNKRLTVCSFRRLTNFGVLIRVRKGYYKYSVTLYFITLIGSIISAVCLLLCLVTFLSLKKLRSKQPTHIHINLCTSLLGFYLAFLFSLLAVSNLVLCSILSATIHFFCLATLFWMSVEAMNMYCTFVRMKQSGIRFFLPIACLFAYGCSAVTTILVAIFDKGNDYKSVQYCFLQPGMALYFGFLAEVAFSFLFNAIICVVVVRKVLCRPLMVSRTTENARRKEIITRLRHCVTFWFVFGLSWVFGFLAAADSKTEIFLYLFCICIAVQGLVMFLMLCVCNPEFRDVFLKLYPRRSASATINLTDLSHSHKPGHNVKT